MTMKEEMVIYKGYLRNLLRQLVALKEVIDSQNNDEAQRLINELIEDTQNNIEDRLSEEED